MKSTRNTFNSYKLLVTRKQAASQFGHPDNLIFSTEHPKGQRIGSTRGPWEQTWGWAKGTGLTGSLLKVSPQLSHHHPSFPWDQHLPWSRTSWLGHSQGYLSTLGHSKNRACWSDFLVTLTNYLNKQLGMGKIYSSLNILRCLPGNADSGVFGGVEYQGGRTFGGEVCLPHDWQETYKDKGNQIKPSKATPPHTQEPISFS